MATDNDMGERLEKVEHGLVKVEYRLEKVEHRTASVEHRLEKVEHRTARVEHRLEKVEQRLEKVEHGLENVDHKVGELTNATKIQFERVHEDIKKLGEGYDAGLKQISKQIEDLDARWAEKWMPNLRNEPS